MDLLGNIAQKQTKNGQQCLEIGYNQSFYDLFSLFVGVGKRFSIKEIAKATNISVDTISNWSQGVSAPQFDNLMILCRVLPFEFKSRFISMLGGSDIVAEIRQDYADLFDALKEKSLRGEI